MGLKDVLGDMVSSGLEWLGDPEHRQEIVGAGLALYNLNNPPPTRSLPPIQYTQLPSAGGPSYLEQIGMGPSSPSESPFLDMILAPDSPGRTAWDHFTNGNGGNAMAANLPVGHSSHSPFARQVNTGLRMTSEVQVIHPITGKQYTYKNMGRPILYSGDLAATKRVRKVAARARRARGK